MRPKAPKSPRGKPTARTITGKREQRARGVSRPTKRTVTGAHRHGKPSHVDARDKRDRYTGRP